MSDKKKAKKICVTLTPEQFLRLSRYQAEQIVKDWHPDTRTFLTQDEVDFLARPAEPTCSEFRAPGLETR